MSKTSRSRRTREEILDAAWDLIAEHGADVSVAEIAGQTGISRQAVYIHFGSRGGLLTALVRRSDDRFGIREDFASAFEASDPRERLNGCLAAWLAFVVKIQPVATELIRLRATDADAAAAWEDRMGEFANVV